MALGDYILCSKCECKLLYDGDRSGRDWWEERFGEPPQIECPDCQKAQRKPLTVEQICEIADRFDWSRDCAEQYARAIEAVRGITGESK